MNTILLVNINFNYTVQTVYMTIILIQTPKDNVNILTSYYVENVLVSKEVTRPL